MLSRGRPFRPSALGQVPLKPLPQVLGKAVSRSPGPCVPSRKVSPHMPVGSIACLLLWAAALGATQPCGVSLTTGGIAPASLRYDCLTPVAPVAGPRCLAGNPFLGCLQARLSSVVAMAPGDVCHGPRCSPAGLGPVALEYSSCNWPGGSAGLPQCVGPFGCGLLRPVLLPPSACVRVRCPGPFGVCSLVRAPCVVRARCPWHLALDHRCARCVRHARVVCGFVEVPSLPFVFLLVFFSALVPLYGALFLLCLLFFF